MEMPARGVRVVAPLGSRLVTGVVVGEAEHIAGSIAVKDIKKVVDSDVYLPNDVIDLALWVAEYYAAGPGDAMATAMPVSAKGGFRTVPVAALTALGQETLSATNVDMP